MTVKFVRLFARGKSSGLIYLNSTGQKPVLKSKQGAFQIIETTSVFRPLCKYTKQVTYVSWFPGCRSPCQQHELASLMNTSITTT
jgi:hypothetical protein